ncbi:MAG: ATP F0F1 synthase subunit B [Alphaproteobacteria bacterium]|nr:ATP F0F1 synthase subunit B [Alphaproteobacteria bacterium]
MVFDQVFWVGSATIAFLALIAKPVGTVVVKSLDTRSNAIEKELNEAKRLRDEAEAVLASYKERQQAAVIEAEEIVAHAKQQAEAYLIRARNDLKQHVEKRLNVAEKKIAQLEIGLIADVKKQAVHEAIAIAHKLLLQQQANFATQSIDQAEADLKQLLLDNPPTN